MYSPDIKVLLNNNPICDVVLRSASKGEIWHIVNKPYILIQGDSFQNGNYEIVVLCNGREIGHNKIDIHGNSFKCKFELDNPLDNVKDVCVFVGKDRFVVPVSLKRLSGTVRYFDGQPVKNPIISCTGEDISAVGDEKGNFEIILPKRVQQIGVFDKGYSESTLEAWLYNVDLKEDAELDIRIDKAEVYGITMWKQYGSDYIHFIPMSLSRCLKVMGREVKGESELAFCDEIHLRLSREDVQVFSDDEEVEVLTFCEVDDFIGYIGGKKVSRPGYVLSIPKDNKNDKVIKIVINSRFMVNGEEIMDKGEGYYFFTS